MGASSGSVWAVAVALAFLGGRCEAGKLKDLSRHVATDHQMVLRADNGDVR